MDFSKFSAVVLLCLFQLVRTGYSLQCYSCEPVLQSGETCGQVRNDQVQTCALNQDICVASSGIVAATGSNAPQINRACASSADYPGSFGVGQRCSNTVANTQFAQNTATKVCTCSTNNCNSYSATDLAGNTIRVYGNTGSAASALPKATCVTGFSAVVLLLLRGILG